MIADKIAINLELEEISETIAAIRYNYEVKPRFQWGDDLNQRGRGYLFKSQTEMEGLLAPLKIRAAVLEMELVGL